MAESGNVFWITWAEQAVQTAKYAHYDAINDHENYSKNE
ncbi:hypothetical protein UUU_37090 [Klebsiella pneumoniae subsp. pneumoniae DSM 30104 = JCM 1662 = NBRC 14940]|nr:hypothetical protein UUU_37090 [Klebsiella pneumoniae subsp. pneumoniae DSM 30104 = JCM 1662 = NBRC 14940]